MEKLILHEDARSGNCYKIRLTAALLGLPLERRNYDIMRGETRTPQFLAAVNANGRIPVLQAGTRFLPESNAACWYLAEGSALIPADRWDQADMLRWMFWEQYNQTAIQRAQLPATRAAGEDALELMDEHLAERAWFVGDGPTLADVSLYAYTHVCEAGGFCLDGHPHVAAWLRRVAALPGFVAMA